MKLSSPKLRKKRKKDAPDEPGETGRASLARLRTQLLICGIAILALLAWFMFHFMGQHISRVIEQEVNVTTGQIAARVGDTVRLYSDTAALLARDPDIAYLFSRGDKAALQSRRFWIWICWTSDSSASKPGKLTSIPRS